MQCRCVAEHAPQERSNALQNSSVDAACEAESSLSTSALRTRSASTSQFGQAPACGPCRERSRASVKTTLGVVASLPYIEHLVSAVFVDQCLGASRRGPAILHQRRLTLRSSGRAPARHLAREALAVYHAPRGPSALPARAPQLKR